MAHLEWSDAFSIGVKVFDDEHRELLVLANALDDAIAAGAGTATVRKLEDDLFEHVTVHFGHEEEYFLDYPFAEEHADHHATLLNRVASYRDAALIHPSLEASAEMLRILSDALVRHIATSDKKLGIHLCATGQASSAH